MICTIVVKVHKLKLHTKYQRLGPLVSDKKIFKVLSIGVCVKTFDFFCKKG